jgi:L-ascorbate metabolism protein UlaG (beta-lactamase superfamily)
MNVFMKNFESAKVDNGVVVWKLYNHGVIIQTKDIRIAVDLISGYDQVKWDDALLQRLVDRVDALLVTHSHADHVDHQVLDMFVKAGKPIVVPEIFWSDYYHNDKLTVMREGELKFEGVTVRVFPSFQSPSLQKEVVDNVYLITTKEGYKIMHLGDENEVFRAGPAWYSKIKKPVDIDILIPNIWSPNLATILKVVKPKLVISSHEHELSHAVSGRRTYDYVYKILRTIKVPYAVPVWGESVRWPPVQGAPAAN